MKPDTSLAYQAAREKCVYRSIENAGPLHISGDDRIAFLQRQSTNDLSRLQAGATSLTVLTNPAARIIDVLRLIYTHKAEQEGFLVMTLPGRFESTYAYLKSRIFFNDRVSLGDRSSAFACLALEGPQSAGVVENLGLELPSHEEAFTSTHIEGGSLVCFSHRGLFGKGFSILAPLDTAGSLRTRLENQGAHKLDAQLYEILRIEAGLPGPDNELTQDYTPLETGLADYISDSKGCYTGQEVIARQITYDKVTQQLCGLRLESPVEAGARLWADGKPAGSLTSYAHSPRFGHIALGIVKRPYNQPGTRLKTGVADGPLGAETCSLPFE